jgi:hypothetical protein
MLATLEKWAGPYATGFKHTSWVEGEPIPTTNASIVVMNTENVRDIFKPPG